MAANTEALFATELQVFEAHLPGWLVHEMGKYVLIKDQEALGPYDTEGDAISIGYQSYGYVPFLVKAVLPFDRPVTLTRILDI